MATTSDYYYDPLSMMTTSTSPISSIGNINTIQLGQQTLTEDDLRRIKEKLSNQTVMEKYEQYINKKEVSERVESEDERFERVVKEAAQKMKL